MKKILINIAIGAMALFVALGISMIPGQTVKADEEVELKAGQTVPIDFRYDRVWWFKVKNNAASMLEISSEGSVSVKVALYKNITDESPIDQANNGSGASYSNFSLIRFLEAGTYYFKVTTSSESTSISSNNTRVTLKDLTDDSEVVKINKTNFPDDAFREYVDDNFDLRDDDKLSADEIRLVDSITLPGASIGDLTGIKYFTELSKLICSNNNITKLDLTSNTKLKEVRCFDNKLTSLDVRGLNDLEELNCNGNPDLSNIKIQGCSNLYELDCSVCKLKKLDLSGFSNLTTLYCQKNPLSELTLSGCERLSYLYVSNTEITSLDLRQYNRLSRLVCSSCAGLTSLKVNSSIDYLDCSKCSLNSLDVSACTDIYYLDCSGNGIKTIDISNSVTMEMLISGDYKVSDTEYSGYVNRYSSKLKFDAGTTIKRISGAQDKVVEINESNFPDMNFRNYLKSFDVDGDGWFNKLEILKVKTISVSNKNITNLDGIKYFTNLRILSCDNNMIKDLDVSANVDLEELNCNSCKMERLKLGNKPKLTYLHCGSNHLTSLDISKCPMLDDLDCYNNELSSLDVSKNTKLVKFACSNNKLTALDVSKNADLYYFRCYNNPLTKLDLRKNTKLERLDCYNCQLKVFDLGKNAVLREMNCSNNKLASIDISGCPLLIKCIKEGQKDPDSYWSRRAVYYSYKGDDITIILIFDAEDKFATTVSLSLDKKTASVACGKNLTLKAITDSSAVVAWKSSNTKIATVDSKGKITAKMAGQVTITATVSGKSAKCVVTVLYKDVINSSDFWYAPTNYLTAKGIVKGYANQTEFRPSNDCTRAQMVTFLYRLQGEPKTKSNECKFDDVKSGDYFYKPVIWAVEQGITTGVSATKFEPQKVCTRAQTVTFLWRMAGKPEPGKNAKAFSDVNKKDYFYKATLWASGMKILAGYDDGTFKPQGKCLRRQMVTFLYKYDKYVNGKG